MRVELQLLSESMVFIEGVESTIMATLYGWRVAPVIEAVASAPSVTELMPIIFSSVMGKLICCFT